MCLILIGSLASTFAAPVPRNSLIVILKECYAFAWFLTLVSVFFELDARDLRRVLVVWSVVVFLHGAVIVAQFVWPAFWRLVVAFSGRATEYDVYRPSGFFVNANSAALFQLLGFVPLVLACNSKKRGAFLGVLLLSTMLVTGSMGATLGFVTGLTVAMIAISISGNLGGLIRAFVYSSIILSLFGGVLLFIVNQNPRYQTHFEQILIGRAERSSDGRFNLWQRGMDAFMDHSSFFYGVGPENFRVVDGKDKQLHNDFIAFTVERGLITGFALVLFGVIAATRAAYLFRIYGKKRADLKMAVFIGAIVAVMVESLTHQIFHYRQMWLILALQEAMILRMILSKSENEDLPSGTVPANGTLSGSARISLSDR